MNQQTNNIYLCITEYHVLLSILISSEIYNSERYRNMIILCNSSRFNDSSIYNFSSFNNINYYLFEKDQFITRNFIDFVNSECTNSLFLFNLNFPHFIYTAYLLNRKGVETSLVQDGLGLYMYLPFTFKEKLSFSRSSFLQLHELGIDDLSFYRTCFGRKGRYGRAFYGYDATANLPFIKNIWLTSPEKAQYAKEKVLSIPPFSPYSISTASRFFNYLGITNHIRKNDILFVDQRIDGSFEFVRELSEKFPQSTIYIKLHPRTPEDWANEFGKNSNVRMINSMKGIPLDLLIQSLSDVIIITSYSAALLFNNPDCKFYFAYPWYAERGYGKGEFVESTIVNPTAHIKVIQSIDEIELYC